MWRHVPRGAEPLHYGFLLRATGRWNRQGRYGCLYCALSASGALAEYRKAVERGILRSLSPHELVSIRVVRVSTVLDLTDPGERREFRITMATIRSDDAAAIEACRAVADHARAEGYRALLAPSAAPGGGVNLVIYVDAPAAELELENGPDRRLIKQ